MENRDPEVGAKAGGLGNRKKINPKSLSLRNKLQDENKSSVRTPDDPDNALKIIEKLRKAENFASTSSLRSSVSVLLGEKDDSLCDFRSPNKDNAIDESIADFQVKPTVSKAHKRLMCKESKPVSKKRRNRNVPSNVNQPSIESSFFKPQTEVKTAFQCPLCLKSHKNENAKHNHMKICAARNKISTNILLDAVQLQEKQAEERRALGLITAPLIQPKKTVAKKSISDTDPQLQLALALSMSLHEAQVTEEIEDAHLLAGEPCFLSNSEMSEERRKTLQNFGFTTNKPVIASMSGKSRKKRPPGPTLLQTRTQEERDRILTVRIAEVLMGDEAITQVLLEDVGNVVESKAKIILKSRLLKSYHCLEDRLWEKTQQCLAGQHSYCNPVEISPRRDKQESEIRSPKESTLKHEPLEYASIPSTSERTADIAAESRESIALKLQITPTSSVTNDKKEMRVQRNADANFITDLSKDWRSMFCSSHMSDVSVIVKGDTRIHAHKLVFWARCYDILNDVTSDDGEKILPKGDRVLWPETESCSAHAFLEFLYCGFIEQYVSVFDYPDMLTEVRVLARKYRLKKLFNYLRDKASELKFRNDEKVENNLESKLYDNFDDNRNIRRGDGSNSSSVDTDINSLSTTCNDFTSNKQAFDDRTSDSDNTSRRHFKAVNINEKENISANLIVDCFSSSNDSVAMRIPTTLTSTKIINEKLSIRRSSPRSFTNVETALTDITGIQNLTTRTKSLDNTNDSDSKITNDTIEEERCTSPDIFDDSISMSSARTYMVSKDPENNANSDSDIELVCKSGNDLEIRSPGANDEDDNTVNVVENNLRRDSEKSRVDLTFVTTQRQKNYETISNRVNNMGLDDRSSRFEPEGTIPGTSLKQKGDITLMIEKARRLNAKTASESDSDCESVETFPKRRNKNPFRINLTNSSSIVEKIADDNEDEIPKKKRHKLSIFEKKIEAEAVKNPAKFNLPIHKPMSDFISEPKRSVDSSESSESNLDRNRKASMESTESSQKRSAKLDDTVELRDREDEIFDLTQESSRESKVEESDEYTSTPDQDLSMFAKYERKHRHNSIAKYRAALMNVSRLTSTSSMKDTEEASSLDELQNFNNESLISNNQVNRDSTSSKYEYTDPDQSTSNLHKELSLDVSPQGNDNGAKIRGNSFNSTKESKKKKTIANHSTEFSDLENDLADFPEVKLRTQLWSSKVNDKRVSTSDKMSNDTSEGFDSFSDVKLADAEFTIMKIELETKKTETCSKILDKTCFDLHEDKSFDIHSEETDAGEMEKKHMEPRHSRSKMNIGTDSKKVVNQKSVDEDRCEILSPDCEISGIFSPPSRSFDAIDNVSNEIDNLLEECKLSSQRFRNLMMNQSRSHSQPLPSTSFVATSSLPKPKNYVDLLNEVSDSEFDDIEFVVTEDSSKCDYPNNKLAGEKSGEKTINDSPGQNDGIIERDANNSGDFEIYKTNNKHITNRSKVFKSLSKPSRSGNMTPKKSSRSSLRSLQSKSISENIIKTKSKSGLNFMNDSSDDELARVQTPPIAQCSYSSNDKKTPQRSVSSENVTPLANYSAMKTPELKKELQKYGIKAQKRHRAKQLLRYIYNELHPLVPVVDNNIGSHSSESSSGDERPAAKKPNRSKSYEDINGRNKTVNIELDFETLASDSGTGSDDSNDIEGLENSDFCSSSRLKNSDSLENVFRRLIEADRDLHNKILTYEPLKLEELYSTLKARGANCKLNALMDFLDEQCITFRTMSNAKKSGTRKKSSPKKKQGIS